MKGSIMDQDLKNKTIAALHALDSDAGRMLESIESKLQNTSDEEALEVAAGGLKTIHLIMTGQRQALKMLLESALEIEDQHAELREKLNIQ